MLLTALHHLLRRQVPEPRRQEALIGALLHRDEVHVFELAGVRARPHLAEHAGEDVAQRRLGLGGQLPHAQGAHEQFGLPYTIIRPFNCVGIGEGRALSDKHIKSGNVELAMSHVVPDLVQKVLKGQDPLHILGDGSQVRHYTYGGDLAHGIRLAMESPAAVNEDFNLSTARSTTVLELARCIWSRVHTDGRPFRSVSDPPFAHDVRMRVPDVRKAKAILGFEATTSLETMLDEVIPWIREELEAGRL